MGVPDPLVRELAGTTKTAELALFHRSHNSDSPGGAGVRGDPCSRDRGHRWDTPLGIMELATQIFEYVYFIYSTLVLTPII